MDSDGSQAADADLAIAMAAGDRQALAAVFDRYAPRLLAFCQSMLRNRADAEDCLQDIFILTATRVAGLREPDRLRSWLFAIARHECLRRIDRRSREVLVDEVPDRTPAQSDRPSEAAVAGELAAMLADAVAGLPDRDRLVLDLADRQGLGTDEVAAALSMSPGSAYKLLTRARATARKSIGALLVARTGRSNCSELDALLGDWNGSMTPLLRKRVARHIELCETCQRQERRVASPAALLGTGTAFAMPVPLGLRQQILDTAYQAAGVPSGPRPSSTGPSWPDGWPPPNRRPQALRRNGSGHADGIRIGAPAAAVAAAVAVALIVGALLGLRGPSVEPQGARAPIAMASSSPAASTGPSTPAGTPADSSVTHRPTTTPATVTTPSTSSPAKVAGGATNRADTTSSLPTSSSRATKPVDTVAPDTAPHVTVMTIRCETSSAGGGRAPVLRWATANAKGIALSVDNPGIVGSYGTYGPSGQVELPPNGCDPAQGTQLYTLYALGTDGTVAEQTVRWVPPPAAGVAPATSSGAPTSPPSSRSSSPGPTG